MASIHPRPRSWRLSKSKVDGEDPDLERVHGSATPRFLPRSGPRASLLRAAAVLALLVCAAFFVLAVRSALTRTVGRHRDRRGHQAHSEFVQQPPAAAAKTAGAAAAAAAAAASQKNNKVQREARVRQLRDALGNWTAGPPPPELAALAAACAPADAVAAILALLDDGGRAPGPSAPRRHAGKVAVIDVGANRGWPATRFALKAGVGHVLSLEPDRRNFDTLAALQVRKGVTSFKPLRVAAARRAGHAAMAFHKFRDDFSCFNCLDSRKPEIYHEEVEVVSLDGLVLRRKEIPEDVPVLLLKTDTQGHEAEVLHGAEGLFKSGRVEHLVVEFDLKLLRTRAAALDVLNTMADAGFQCVHLAFKLRAVGKKSDKSILFRGAGPISRATASRFIKFVKEADGYTDLLCARR